MANLTVTEATNGQVYSGSDFSTAVEVCTPIYIGGTQACISATAEGGDVILTITLKSPFGNFTKSFRVKGNISFTFEPVSNRLKVNISINNFVNKDGKICFDLSAQVCINIPIIGWKCWPYSHYFCLPHLLASADFDNMSDAEFSNHLALLLLVNDKGNSCCCNKG